MRIHAKSCSCVKCFLTVHWLQKRVRLRSPPDFGSHLKVLLPRQLAVGSAPPQGVPQHTFLSQHTSAHPTPPNLAFSENTKALPMAFYVTAFHLLQRFAICAHGADVCRHHELMRAHLGGQSDLQGSPNRCYGVPDPGLLLMILESSSWHFVRKFRSAFVELPNLKCFVETNEGLRDPRKY